MNCAVRNYLFFYWSRTRLHRAHACRMYSYDPSKPTKAFINGAWVNARSNQVFEVQDPATCQKIAVVPDMSVEDAKLAVQAASEAFRTWRTMTAKERGEILRNWYNLLTKNQQELAKVLFQRFTSF